MDYSMEELMRRGLQMPGETCGQWGVCGSYHEETVRYRHGGNGGTKKWSARKK